MNDPVIEGLSDAEREAGLAALAEALGLAASMAESARQTESCSLDLGKRLAEIVDRGWARRVCQQTFDAWIEANSHLTKHQAEQLVSHWRSISQAPTVERAVREGKAPRTSAHYAVAKELLEGPMDAEAELRALEAMRDNSSRRLRVAYYAVKNRVKPELEHGQRQRWTLLMWDVPEEVNEDLQDLLRRIVRVEGDALSMEKMSPTQRVERLVGWGKDSMDAIEAALDGDVGPMESLFAQVRVRRLAS